MRKGFLLCIPLAALFVFGGCFHIRSRSSVSQQPPSKSLYDIAVPDDFRKEIESLSVGIVVYADKRERAQVYLKMAILSCHHKNPFPDYDGALEELDRYMELDPAGAADDEVLQLRRFLRAITTLQEENEKLDSDVKKLGTEVDEMKESIEKLKSLDIRMEQKRQQVK